MFVEASIFLTELALRGSQYVATLYQEDARNAMRKQEPDPETEQDTVLLLEMLVAGTRWVSFGSRLIDCMRGF